MTLPLQRRGFTLAEFPGASDSFQVSAPLPATAPIARNRHDLGTLLGQAAGRLMIILIAIIGLGTIYDEAIGDGPLPRLNRIAAIKPSVTEMARQNSTRHLPAQATAIAKWNALSPSRDLLTGVSPQISAWLYELQQQERIIYSEPQESLSLYPMPKDTEAIAAYRHINGRLYLGNAFWRLSDGQKVAVLAHEYRHSQQSLPKRISRQLAQLAGMGHFDYQSPIEEEAFAYERQALSAVGL